MDDHEFFDVELGSNSPNGCSPSAPLGHGLVIQAPTKTSFKRGEPADDGHAFAVIPICGVYDVEVPKTPSDDAVLIIALDVASGKRHEGPIREIDPSPMAPEPDVVPFTPEELEGMSVTSYFNANVARFVGLPTAAARYEIWVEFRGMSSNRVVIEVEEI
jgi:hypothetical protein